LDGFLILMHINTAVYRPNIADPGGIGCDSCLPPSDGGFLNIHLIHAIPGFLNFAVEFALSKKRTH